MQSSEPSTSLVDTPQLSDYQRACLEQYDLGPLEATCELSGGMFARPIMLRTKRGAFVLRAHTFRSTEPAFRFQAETLQWAFDHGVPCARVERTKSGEWCVPLPGGQGVLAIHHYVDGASCDWRTWQRRKETESNFLFQLGGRVAHLHNQLSAAKPSGDAHLPIDLPPIQFVRLEQVYILWKEAVRELETHQAVACRAARLQFLELGERIDTHWQCLLETADKHGLATWPRQIVHGDVSAVNIVWRRPNQPVFIDWDAVHYGHRLYDALGDVLNRVPDDRPDLNRYRKDHVEEYLAGYASVLDEPLSGQERQFVPAFCLARQLEDLRQRVAVLKQSDRAHEHEYARMIRMRVEIMDQIEVR